MFIFCFYSDMFWSFAALFLLLVFYIFNLFIYCYSVKTGGNGVVFALETDDVEGAIAKAVKGGAVVDIEGAAGDGRVGKVTDPYGYAWQISAPVKKVDEVVA